MPEILFPEGGKEHSVGEPFMDRRQEDIIAKSYRDHVQERLSRLEDRQSTIEHQLTGNTAITAQIKNDTQELVRLVKLSRNALNFFIVLGAAIKWIGGLCIGLAAIWAIVYAAMHPGIVPTSLTDVGKGKQP